MREIQMAVECAKCGSQDILSTANVIWNKARGDWVLMGEGGPFITNNETYCANCNDSCDINYIDEVVS